MNTRKSILSTLTAVVIAASGGIVLAQGGKPKPGPTPSKSSAQKATVTIDHGYQPANVSVKAGRPVELTLVRKETSGCGDTVQFPSLGIKRTLKPGEKTVVKFTPKKSGNITFSCGMNMYKGQVVVK